MDDIATIRRAYADRICNAHGSISHKIVDIFATVQRENFLGPPPWLVGVGGPTRLVTRIGDIYADVLVALDADAGINNGQPSLWARMISDLNPRSGERVLHLGCGSGYYTAILAEAVGPDGEVEALEIDSALATRAKTALAPWPQVRVQEADGSRGPFAPTDAIVIGAGAAELLPCWLDALKIGGRLLFPLTARMGGGALLRVARLDEDHYAARLLSPVRFIDFSGARDKNSVASLQKAFESDAVDAVRALRRDEHAPHPSCWLHGEGWCLSQRAPSG